MSENSTKPLFAKDLENLAENEIILMIDERTEKMKKYTEEVKEEKDIQNIPALTGKAGNNIDDLRLIVEAVSKMPISSIDKIRPSVDKCEEALMDFKEAVLSW